MFHYNQQSTFYSYEGGHARQPPSRLQMVFSMYAPSAGYFPHQFDQYRDRLNRQHPYSFFSPPTPAILPPHRRFYTPFMAGYSSQQQPNSNLGGNRNVPMIRQSAMFRHNSTYQPIRRDPVSSLSKIEPQPPTSSIGQKRPAPADDKPVDDDVPPSNKRANIEKSKKANAVVQQIKPKKLSNRNEISFKHLRHEIHTTPKVRKLFNISAFHKLLTMLSAIEAKQPSVKDCAELLIIILGKLPPPLVERFFRLPGKKTLTLLRAHINHHIGTVMGLKEEEFEDDEEEEESIKAVAVPKLIKVESD